VELLIGDSSCGSLTDDLIYGRLNIVASVDRDAAWQIIIRCNCAISFCAGRVGKRNDFNWNQETKTVYRYLLIDFFRSEALYWAHKMYGSRTADSQLSVFKKKAFSGDPKRN
jgi:hypothetical protein